MATNTLTIAVPEALMTDANQLFLVMGQSPADANSFREPNFERDRDEDEPERYCVRSTVVSDEWLERLNGELLAPDFAPDADVAAATRARDAMDAESPAAPEKIAMRVGIPVADALAEFELG